MSEGLSTFVSFIDFRKAFDCIDRDMLFYKLLVYGIDGNMYFLLTNMYAATESCVRVNSYLTEWFKTSTGVMQGDSVSPTMFSLFINDLALGLKDLDIGIDIGGRKLCILLYADDVAIVTNDQVEMQAALDFVTKWCRRWKMSINMSKYDDIGQ